ncbi:t family of potassium channels protein 18 [Lasius niger]|uniref:T family of potassium channels protein 18 n=1 Tax=Lasius niger TaxID=67767 RepID=A0A0J7L4B8_LASNI|nr:t family of potassium channels protein 18 [Lasius niger]
MEDSYTVHRRRKAAARKREKTPDPSSRGAASRMDTSDDEDEERRARMERMAEEAEKMDQQQKDNKLAQQRQEESAKEPENRDKKKDVRQEQRPARRKDRTDARKSGNVDDMIAIRAEVAAKSTVAGNSSGKTDAAAADDNNTQLIKQATEVMNKVDDESTAKREVIKAEIVQVVKENLVAQETSETPKETNGEIVRPAEVRKVERRFKRKSKEHADRYSRSSDSSDENEKSESSQRRTKSPEAARPRAKKSSGKSRVSDPEIQKRDAERQNREKRSSSRQKLEDEPRTKDNAEKPRSKPDSQTEDTDEDSKNIKKSENFPQRSEGRMIKKSSIELKKQIIPLNNESLIEDFARAQREYMLRERSILDPESTDVFQDAIETSFLRRRRFSPEHTDSEHEEIVTESSDAAKSSDKKKSWFSWMLFWRKEQERKQDNNDDIVEEKIEDEPKSTPKVEEIKAEKQEEAPEKVTLLDFFRALKDIVGEFKVFVAQNPRETMIIRRLRNRCIAGLLLVMIYCGLGGFVFRFVEGAFETFYKCGVKRVKRDFLDSLWNYSHNLREDDWKSMARKKLMEFEEQLHNAHEAGLHSYSGQKSWSFLNAVVYCLTVITTIGEKIF